MKPKLLLCLALVLSGVLFGCCGVLADEHSSDTEPRYLEKSLSEWIPLAEWVGGDIPHARDERASTAVLDIGTNALPWLLQWIRSDKPETVRLGVEGFALLGLVAKPAEPELLKMALAWQTSTAWSNAIPILVSLRNTNDSLHLLSLATNQSVPVAVRARILESVAKAGCNYSADAVFLRAFQDRDWRVAEAAATDLGFCTDRKLTVSAISACLLSRTNGPEDAAVRQRAVESLIGPAQYIFYPSTRSKSELDDLRQSMRSADPALIIALNDRDWRIAQLAATGLGEAMVEPDIVVPSLIKSLHYPYSDPRGYVRLAAIEGLGNFGEAARSAVPELTQLAQSDPLGYVGGSFAANALKKINPQKP